MTIAEIQISYKYIKNLNYKIEVEHLLFYISRNMAIFLEFVLIGE